MRPAADPTNQAYAELGQMFDRLTVDEFVYGFKRMPRSHRDSFCIALKIRSPRKQAQVAGTGRQVFTLLRGLTEASRFSCLMSMSMAVTEVLAGEGKDSEMIVSLPEAGDSDWPDTWLKIAAAVVQADMEFAGEVDNAAAQRGGTGADATGFHAAAVSSPEELDDVEVPSWWSLTFSECSPTARAVIDWVLFGDRHEPIDMVLRDLTDRGLLDEQDTQVVHGVADGSRRIPPRGTGDWYAFGWIAAHYTLSEAGVTPAGGFELPDKFPTMTLVRVAALANGRLADALAAYLWKSDTDAASRIIKNLSPSSPACEYIIWFLIQETHSGVATRGRNQSRAARLALHLIELMEDAEVEFADTSHGTLLTAKARVLLDQASAARFGGRFQDAQNHLAAIDTELLDERSRVGYLTEQLMVSTGTHHILQPPFPTKAGDRTPNGFERFRSHLPIVEQIESASSNHGVMLTSLIRAALAEIDGDDLTAADCYQRVLDALGSGSPIEPPVRFHRAMTLLRPLDVDTLEDGWAELEAAVSAGYKPTATEWTDAFELLEVTGSDHRHEWLDTAISTGFDWKGFVPTVVADARRGDKAARSTAADLANNSKVSPSARFELVTAALEGATIQGDTAEIEAFVDLAEDVLVSAGHRDLDGKWADHLQHDEQLRSIIGPIAADLMCVHLLQRSARVVEATDLAVRVFWRVHSGGHLGYSTMDLIHLVEELGADADTLAPLLRAVDAAGDKTPATEQSETLTEPVRVVFVGGNESQKRYQIEANRTLRSIYGDKLQITWVHPGWGSNWMTAAEQVEACYPDHDALVLMAYVRTNLGRRLRRTSGESGVPWVACTGHGRGSMVASVAQAVAVAQRNSDR